MDEGGIKHEGVVWLDEKHDGIYALGPSVRPPATNVEPAIFEMVDGRPVIRDRDIIREQTHAAILADYQRVLAEQAAADAAPVERPKAPTALPTHRPFEGD